jgi:hypothetical protein
MKKLVFFALLVLLYSCAATDYMFSNVSYKVDVDSYTLNKSIPSEYYLGTSYEINPFLKSEIEGYLEKILSMKGLKRVYEKKVGVYGIGYYVEMEETEKMITGIYPIQGVTGTTTNSNAKGNIDYFGNATVKGNETTTYNRGTVGWGTYQKPATYYAKRILLVGGIKGEENMKPELLWQMNVGTWSGGNDLRKSIPFMLAGCFDFINSNTKGIKSTTVYPSNEIYNKIIK